MMKKVNQTLLNTVLAGVVLAALSTNSGADLPEPNAAGISTGHTHLSVPDAAKHTEIWKLFGATEVSSGTRQFLSVPGMYIFLTERESTAPSAETTANHVAFSVQDYDLYKAKLSAVGATILLDNEDNRQIVATLPDGVSIEFLEDTNQSSPIAFHHTHLAVEDQESLRTWYLEVFGAEAGERNGMLSAVIPGGRIDFFAPRGGEPLPTQGTAIDHIGFEVDDMAAFAAKMADMGIEFNRGPERIDAINLTIAFITDPVGTYIEITEGLDDVE